MRKKAAKFFRSAVVAALAVAAAGCAGRLKPAFLTRPPAPTIEQLRVVLGERARPVRTLWIRGRVSIWQRGLPGRQHFEATILLEPPDRLRLRAYRNATILIFDLLADGEGIRLHDIMEKSYYAADYATLRRSRSVWLWISPPVLSRALLADQTVLGDISSAHSVRIRRRWKTSEIRLERETGSERVFFDPRSERIVEIRYKAVSGGRALAIKYGESIEAEGFRLPRWIEITYGPLGLRLRLDVSQYKVNRAFRPEVFEMRPPPGETWLPLEKAQ